VFAINRVPVSFYVRSVNGNEEHLAIEIGGRDAGGAVIRYDSATAIVDARVEVAGMPQVTSALDRFHYEFASELLAYVLDRGAMAQESDGSIIYDLGYTSHALPLPANHEVGLGYPNSW
jgi:hypothetical protein